jgi:hypothetical protein
MSNEEINEEMKELLRQAVTPVQDTELRRDLWPQMFSKLEEQPLPIHNVSWFDWALASLAAAALLFFPGIIPALFYHL